MSNRVGVLNEQLKQSEGEEGVLAVLGACFMDYIGYVDRMPHPGETLHSKSFAKGFGGKGANQAVAAGRLGTKVRLFSVVGSDGDGADYVAQLKKNSVDTTFVFRKENTSTGLAMIFVDTNSAQNEIVICPNVTLTLTPTLLTPKEQFWRNVKFFLCQHEVPLPTTLALLKEAHARGAYTIFNAAPAPGEDELPEIRKYLRFVSLFCPNETEASLVTGVKVVDHTTGREAITKLHDMGIKSVVVTLGAQGFLLSEAAGAAAVHVPGVKVKAVDTTGAGDCFIGAMVHYLAKGVPLLESCKRANQCAAISVQRKGTQTSFPYPHELPQNLRRV